MPETRPNILLITSDQQHWNTLGCLNPEIQTPHLDTLTQQGTLFNRAYCPNPTCTPTRASIITGKYPSQHGAWSLGTKLSEDEHTVGEDFMDADYRTALVGKAHFQTASRHRGIPVPRILSDSPRFGLSGGVSTNRSTDLNTLNWHATTPMKRTSDSITLSGWKRTVAQIGATILHHRQGTPAGNIESGLSQKNTITIHGLQNARTHSWRHISRTTRTSSFGQVSLIRTRNTLYQNRGTRCMIPQS